MLFDLKSLSNYVCCLEKRDAMEQFIEPENLVGLNIFKSEIIKKQQEKEKLE
jgi:hypothetical protein